MNKITFPFNGINNNNSYETQPLGTCASAQNVRGYDAIKGRLRGGQRAGLSKFYDSTIDGSNNIIDLNRLKATPQYSDKNMSGVIVADSAGGGTRICAFADGATVDTYYTDNGHLCIADGAGHFYMKATPANTQVRKLDTDFSTVLWNSVYDDYWDVPQHIVFDSLRNRVLLLLSDLSTLDDNIICIDGATGETLWSYRTQGTYTNCAAIDSVGNYYITCQRYSAEQDGCPIGTSLIKFAYDGTILGSYSSVTLATFQSVDINSSDQLLLCVSKAGTGYDNLIILDSALSLIDSFEVIFNSTTNSVYCALWYSDGHILATGNYDAAINKSMMKVNSSTGAEIWSFDLGDEGKRPHCIDYDSDGYIYISVPRNNTWTGAAGAYANVFSLEEAGDGSSASIRWTVDTGSSYSTTVYARAFSTPLSSSSRDLTSIVSSAGTIKILDGGSLISPTGSETAMGGITSDRIVFSQPAFGKIFFVNGYLAKQYTPAVDSGDDAVSTWIATDGTMPPNPTILALYRGRMVVTDLNDKHNWYMSKVGDPFDWDYFPSTTSAIQAVAGNNSEVGLIGDNVTGIAPWSDDLCVFGCDSSLWLMAGDPAAGGSIDLITDKTGMTFGKAWCFDPNGVMYFHGVSGIFRLVPGGKPESITDDSIKRIMESLDLSSYYIRLYWDINQGGLYMVYIKQDYSAIGSIYFWDTKQNAWWYDEYLSATTTPLSFYAFDADAADDRYFLMGCKDGYIRKVDKTATTDDGVGIESEVILGPYIASPGKSLRLSNSDITLGKTGGNLDLYIYSGDYAEDVIVSSNSRVKRALKAGLNRRINQRVKAPALKFKLQSPSTTTTQWALENLSISIKESGTTRGGRV